jgi:hypothetical protein
MQKENHNAGVVFGHGYCTKNIEHMGYLANCRDLGQTAAEIQARLPALLDAYCWLKLQKRERSFPRRLADSFVPCIARYAGSNGTPYDVD